MTAFPDFTNETVEAWFEQYVRFYRESERVEVDALWIVSQIADGWWLLMLVVVVAAVVMVVVEVVVVVVLLFLVRFLVLLLGFFL